jgi:hypothetical protein
MMTKEQLETLEKYLTRLKLDQNYDLIQSHLSTKDISRTDEDIKNYMCQVNDFAHRNAMLAIEMALAPDDQKSEVMKNLKDNLNKMPEPPKPGY